MTISCPFEAGEHFDVGGAGDAGGYGDKLGAEAALGSLSTTKTPCTGFDLAGGGGRLNAALALAVVHRGVVHGERLDGQREHADFVGGGDLGGAGEAGAQFVGGLSRVTTTLKSLASSVPVVDWEVAMPVERSRA